MKDQTRNIETFKVGATRVNEFDFHKHQGQMHQHHDETQTQDANQTESRAEKVARLTKQAREKAKKRKNRR